jgi:hypothetical protein
MKTLITLFGIVLGFGTMAQEQVQELKPRKINLIQVEQPVAEEQEVQYFEWPGCILRFIDPASPSRKVDYSMVSQPTTINELPNGTMPLSEDLPYVHTIRGAVYTADYLRYTVRN